MDQNANRPPEQRRSYRAPIRREQAELTRRRILEAARRVFAERGYAATTVEAIAAQADVAVPTLYAAVGTKRQILAQLVLQLKDLHDVPARVRALMADPDPRRQLQLAARVVRDFESAAWDVMEVLDAAAKADPELAELWDQVEGARLRDQQEQTARLAGEGALKPGLDSTHAADIYWGLTGHELYHLLVVRRGWTDDDYEQWLAATLSNQLLR